MLTGRNHSLSTGVAMCTPLENVYDRQLIIDVDFSVNVDVHATATVITFVFFFPHRPSPYRPHPSISHLQPKISLNSLNMLLADLITITLKS